MPLWLTQLGFYLLRLLPPEASRKVGFWCAKHSWVPRFTHPPSSNKMLFGKSVPSLIGLAAGADKNAEALPGWFKLGFGFAEPGSVSYYPWKGNNGTRLWRFGKGLINFYGLNSQGVSAFHTNLVAFRALYGNNPLVGASLVNPDPQASEKDELFADMAKLLRSKVDYFTINFSCPNSAEKMTRSEEVLTKQTRATKHGAGDKPVLWKLAYIANDNLLARTVHLGKEEKVRGYVVANTFTYAMAEEVQLFGKETAERLKQWPQNEQGEPIGGYSGPETRTHVLDMVRRIHRLDRHAVIIACGGTSNWGDMRNYLLAGANAVQLYTTMATAGPSALYRIFAGAQR